MSDDADLRFAARELAAAHAMLLVAHAVRDRRDRGEAIKTAIGRLALASRAIRVVVDRRTDDSGLRCDDDEHTADENGDFPPLAE